MTSKKKLKITLVRSTCKAIPNHKECVKGLGLRRTNHSVVVSDTPCNRGMINKVIHLLSIEEV
jgi:large subunit ribosomal protein L30